MRYTFLLYSNPADFQDVSEEDMQASLAAFGEYITALKDAGVFIDTDWLQPPMTATTISLKGGEETVQDGAFADTKEQLGGYFAVDVPDLDTALAWARKCPAVHYGYVEVRPTAFGQ